MAPRHPSHPRCCCSRDPTNEALVGPLKALPGAAQRLRLFRADLMEAGSFDEAVAGCDYVLHTASPFVINVRAGGVGVGLWMRGWDCGCGVPRHSP